MELSQVIEEIRLVPKDRLREIYNFIHFFRLGLENVQDETEDIMQFAGCWHWSDTMKYPKVRSVKATENHILIVEFDNHEKKQYDVTPLLEKAMFAPLRNTALFKSVRVEQGGWAVSWNDEIDLSEFELWNHGKAVDERHESGRQNPSTHFSQKAIEEADNIWEEQEMTAQTMDNWLNEK